MSIGRLVGRCSSAREQFLCSIQLGVDLKSDGGYPLVQKSTCQFRWALAQAAISLLAFRFFLQLLPVGYHIFEGRGLKVFRRGTRSGKGTGDGRVCLESAAT